jgi:nucleoside-diphosphate-sugar epimerase
MAVIAAMARGLDATVLRFGTLYGYSWATRYDAFVNRLVYLAATGQAVTIYGSGDQTRPVVHVNDAARSVAFCLESDVRTFGEIYNVLESNPAVMNVIDVLHELIPGIRVRYTDQDAMLSHFSFWADSTKISKVGWRPQTSLFSGMRELAERFANISAALPVKDISVDIV